MSHPLVRNAHYQTYDVLCDRTTAWGNPYRRGTRTQNIQRYRSYLNRRIDLTLRLHELRSKRLGCWCAPKACHCDVLATLANLPKLTVLCCGSRFWSQWTPIVRALAILPKGSHVIHGSAPGADTMCSVTARELGHAVSSHPAQWNRYGRAAGPIRNQEMLDHHPSINLTFAFHDTISTSRGTRDMVNRCLKANIHVVVLRNRLFLPVSKGQS